MKKLTKVLLSSFVLFSFSSVAAEDLHNKLIIRKRHFSTVWQILKFLRGKWTPNMVSAIHEIINRSA